MLRGLERGVKWGKWERERGAMPAGGDYAGEGKLRQDFDRLEGNGQIDDLFMKIQQLNEHL